MVSIIDLIKPDALYYCIASSVILHFLLLNRKKNELKVNSVGIFIITIICNITCILASKVLYGIEFMISHYGMKPMIVFESGFSFFGIVYFAPVFYIILSYILKLDSKKVLDIATPAVLISCFCCRLNCLFAGCCGGIEIKNTGINVPTREIELVCYLLIFILVLYKERKNTLIPGTAYPLFFIIYGLVRLIEEPFREAFAEATIHFAIIHSTISIIIGGILYLAFLAEHKKEKSINNDSMKNA